MNWLLLTFFPYLCILSLSAVAIIFTERAGIINLSINGVMVGGATMYMIFAYIIAPLSKNPTPMSSWLNIFLFLMAAIGGILISCFHGFISITLKGNQTISGIAINIIAPALTLIILYLFGEANRMDYNVGLLELGNSKNGELISIISFKVVITLIVILVSFVFFTFTKSGLRFKVVGENPQAADVAGINVTKVKWSSIIISGAIAGIAGAIYISEFSNGGSFKSQVNVEGLGFLAIAIVINGRWKVLPSTLFASIFAILFSLAQNSNNLFTNGETIKPILMMLPYLFTLVILVLFSKYFFQLLSNSLITLSRKQKNQNSNFNKNLHKISNKLVSLSNIFQPPKALGQPYDKSKR